MPAELFASGATTTVSSGGATAPPAGTEESWTVASSASFPAASSGSGSAFHIVDPARPGEIIGVTNVSGTTWTVTRGTQNTKPVAHAAGFAVWDVPTAYTMGGFTQTVNVRSPAYGAKGDGAADDTRAFQAALNALAAAGGGVLYVPAGDYEITADLTWTSASTLYVRGEGPLATKIRPNRATAPFVCLSISNSGHVIMEDFSLLTDNWVGNHTGTYVGIGLTSVGWSVVNRVYLATGANGNRITTGIALNGCVSFKMSESDIRAYVTPLFATNTQVITVMSTALYANDSQGTLADNACVLLDGATATLQLTNVVTNSGDFGMITRNGRVASQPAFVFLHDVEINNPAMGGIRCDTGSQFWGEQVWLSDQSQANGTRARHGIELGTGYQGFFYLNCCTFQHWSGHGLWIRGGTGFSVSDCSFTGTGGYAPNTYDDIHIASGGPDMISIHGNHFGVDPFNTTWARSGVYVEPGPAAVTIDGNIFSKTLYRTAPVIDNSGKSTGTGNSGYWGPLTTAAGFRGYPVISQTEQSTMTVTQAAFTRLSSQFTIPAGDARAASGYRLKVYGNGRTGTTPQALAIQLAIDGTASCAVGLGGLFLPASTDFGFTVEADLIVETTGTGGTCAAFLRGILAQLNAPLDSDNTVNPPATPNWVNSYPMLGASTGSAFNTTVPNTVEIDAMWSATTGGPFIQSQASTLERLGPLAARRDPGPVPARSQAQVGQARVVLRPGT